MSTPAAPPAPAAPADAGTPAAPKTLIEKQRELKGTRVKPPATPSQGSFVRVGGKAMATKPAPVAPPMDAKPATAGAKAGAPAAAPVAAPPVEAASEKPAGDPMAELKKDRDARARELADISKRLGELETLRKTNFPEFVRQMAKEGGTDPREVAENLLLEHAQRWQEEQELAKLSPEEREYRELKRDAEKRKADDAKRAEDEKVAARQAVERHSYEATSTKLIEAHKLLPESIRNHPEFAGRAALRVKDALLAKALAVDPNMPADEFLRSIDPAKLAAETMAEHRAELRLALLAADDAGVDELLTPEVAQRWTKRLQAQAVARAHPSLKAQPRAGDGKFAKAEEKPAPKPLSAMRPAWSNFLPKPRR